MIGSKRMGGPFLWTDQAASEAIRSRKWRDTRRYGGGSRVAATLADSGRSAGQDSFIEVDSNGADLRTPIMRWHVPLPLHRIPLPHPRQAKRLRVLMPYRTPSP